VVRCLKGIDPDGLIYRNGDLHMIGAMVGDVAGSGYERSHNNIKHKPDFLIRDEDKFTDDTVLTYAVALGIWNGMEKIDRSVWLTDTTMQKTVEREIALSVKHWGRKYPHAGYGKQFKQWVASDSMEPYDSLGNGSAMRVSFAGWYARSMEEAELLARLSAQITHNHKEGIKGAIAVAGCIYLLRTGHGKNEVRRYAGKYYNLEFTLDAIRPSYRFDVTCEGSVPQAIVAFLENDDFEEAIRAAISIGGDSDTIAAIAGSIAEACYEIPRDLAGRAISKLDADLIFAAKTVVAILRSQEA
jgi:type I restriction enzyme M protein